MSSDSTIYTMGTALNRAHDNQVPVAVLVEGQWIHGLVAAIDGHGVVLANEDTEHAVVKLERVSAVRVMTAAPGHDNQAENQQAAPVPHPRVERHWSPQSAIPA